MDSQLVYIRDLKGIVTAQVWHDHKRGVSTSHLRQIGTAKSGLPIMGYAANRVLARIDIKPEHEHVGLDTLIKWYPLPASTSV